jgi:7,8-dihydro-6-hydroxymethylpterin dimethyltransferase
MHELKSFVEHRDYFSERVESLCPVCLKAIHGTLRESTAGLVMEKRCPDHGPFSTAIWTDLQSYKDLCLAARKVVTPQGHGAPSKGGCPEDCGLCPSHNQHTCLAILEITSRCDLGCPVCLAGSRPKGEDLTLADIEYALRRLIDYEGCLTPIQLSGGEPTLHPELTDIVKLVRSLGGRGIELNTNGLALAGNRYLAEMLRDAGLSSVYLQMDSLDPAVSELIRGSDLVETKVKAIENCIEAGLEVILSVTVVPGVNDRELWTMVRFGVDHRLTGVNFQALTLSGRYPEKVGKGEDHFTGGHFLRELEKQSNGKLLKGEMSTIPCPDPRCGLILYALIQDGELVPLNRLLEGDKLFDCLAELKDWRQTLQHISKQCFDSCCCSTNGHSADEFSTILSRSDFFSIGFHGMMDAYSLDIERVRRCGVHEITSEGKLIPFCLYNMKYRKDAGEHGKEERCGLIA